MLTTNSHLDLPERITLTISTAVHRYLESIDCDRDAEETLIGLIGEDAVRLLASAQQALEDEPPFYLA